MRTVTLKLPKHLDKAFDRMARDRGVSRSEIMRRALEAYAGKPKPSALDVLGDFVGACRGGSPDLSTNPEYLEGLGKYRPLRGRRHRAPLS